MGKTTVTVAIAVYHVEAYIGKCLDSVLNQDYEDLDILVVDDRGEDNSIAIVEEMSRTRPGGEKIRIVHHERNAGLAGVRNTSIEEARGEFLFFMDGDDYLAPDCIRLLYEASVSGGADITMGNWQRIYPDGRIERTSAFVPGRNDSAYAIADWMRVNHSHHYPVATWNKLFRTRFFRDNDIHCVPGQSYEDMFFSLQTAFAARSIITIPEVTYYWVQREGSLVHQEATEWHLKQYLDVFDHCLALFKEKESQISGHYPKELYWMVTETFLDGFYTHNICSSTQLSFRQKNAYLKHLRAITRHIKRKDEFGGRRRLFYSLIQLPLPYVWVKLLTITSVILSI